MNWLQDLLRPRHLFRPQIQRAANSGLTNLGKVSNMIGTPLNRSSSEFLKRMRKG